MGNDVEKKSFEEQLPEFQKALPDTPILASYKKIYRCTCPHRVYHSLHCEMNNGQVRVPIGGISKMVGGGVINASIFNSKVVTANVYDILELLELPAGRGRPRLPSSH